MLKRKASSSIHHWSKNRTAIESTGTVSEIKRQDENRKRFVGKKVFYFLSSLPKKEKKDERGRR